MQLLTSKFIACEKAIQYNKSIQSRKIIYDMTSGNLRTIFDFYTNEGQYFDNINIIDDIKKNVIFLKKYLKYEKKYLRLNN